MTGVIEIVAMKVVASLVLLSLPAALAAILPDHYEPSPATTSSRPDTALRIPAPTAPVEQPLNLQPRAPDPLPTITVVTSSSSSAAPVVGPAETGIGVFTAEGIAYTVTSVTGVEKVDGKTLTPGAAPINIGGVDVIERGGGAFVANGMTVKFHPVTASSSGVPGGVPGNSQSSSASSSAAASSSSSGSGNAAAMPTANCGGMVALGVGAVVGGFML